MAYNRTSNPGEPWYDALSEGEAREVHALEGIIDALASAIKIASERRGDIQKRVTQRLGRKIDSEERKLNWRIKS